MNWRTATLHDIERLFRALEQAKPDDAQVVERIMNRVESTPNLRHGRITIDSLLQLLDRTEGSIWLPDEVVVLLRRLQHTLTETGGQTTPAFAGWSFSQLLAACDQQVVDSGFTEAHFPLVDDGTGNLPVEEYCFNRVIADLDVVTELGALGFKPVGIKRALEYMATHPQAQLDHIVIVIGANHPAGGRTVVPYFHYSSGVRQICLSWLNGGTYVGTVRFLVVSEPGRNA